MAGSCFGGNEGTPLVLVLQSYPVSSADTGQDVLLTGVSTKHSCQPKPIQSWSIRLR